eukprot:TRINITY_DN4263_c0_g1_i1.p1 TRINITY_DN4263_c0_g1~~TRINITY_DN4263_c0_g1_i1.p1  ORF type:complete len:110 (-),score=22.00 TRINITY_DN4263_c0_g1_i1:228-557(-)
MGSDIFQSYSNQQPPQPPFSLQTPVTMKLVAAFILVTIAVVYGQFFCPDSAADFTCYENSPTLKTCMKLTGTQNYFNVCGYCGKKNATCFGNMVAKPASYCSTLNTTCS